MIERNEPFRDLQPGMFECGAFVCAQVAHIFGMEGDCADPRKLMQRTEWWGEDGGGPYFKRQHFDHWFMNRGGNIEQYTPFPHSGGGFNPGVWDGIARNLGLSEGFGNPGVWEEIEEAACLRHPQRWMEVLGVPSASDVVGRLAAGKLVMFSNVRPESVHLGLAFDFRDVEGEILDVYNPQKGLLAYQTSAAFLEYACTIGNGITSYSLPGVALYRQK
jgi:hypothetical protein